MLEHKIPRDETVKGIADGGKFGVASERIYINGGLDVSQITMTRLLFFRSNRYNLNEIGIMLSEDPIDRVAAGALNMHKNNLVAMRNQHDDACFQTNPDGGSRWGNVSISRKVC